MKKKSIITLLLTLFVLTGCKQNVDTVAKNPSKSVINSSSTQTATTDTTEEMTTKTNSDNIQEISSSDFSDKVEKLNKAVILVGNPKNSNYQEISGELSKVCKEMDVALYQTDLTDEAGQKIKEQYKFGSAYDILVVIGGKIQRIEVGGGDRLNADILQKVFEMYGL